MVNRYYPFKDVGQRVQEIARADGDRRADDRGHVGKCPQLHRVSQVQSVEIGIPEPLGNLAVSIHEARGGGAETVKAVWDIRTMGTGWCVCGQLPEHSGGDLWGGGEGGGGAH